VSVAAALAISVYVNAPLFSRRTGCLYLSKQLRRLFFAPKAGFLLSLRKKTVWVSKRQDRKGRRKRNKLLSKPCHKETEWFASRRKAAPTPCR